MKTQMQLAIESIRAAASTLEYAAHLERSNKMRAYLETEARKQREVLRSLEENQSEQAAS